MEKNPWRNVRSLEPAGILQNLDDTHNSREVVLKMMVHRLVRSKSLRKFIAAASMGMLAFSTIAATGMTGAKLADRSGMILTCIADQAEGHTCCPPSGLADSTSRLGASSREAHNDCSCAPAGSAPYQHAPAIPTMASRAPAEPSVCKVSLIPAALWAGGGGSRAALHISDLQPTASNALPLFVLYRSLLI